MKYAYHKTLWYLCRQAKAVEMGGYDYEFVVEVPSKYICSICTKVLREAHLAVCCGKHFCNSCLMKWLKSDSRKTCPHCRQSKFQHVLNKEKICEIKQLSVRCTNVEKGCKWEGELGDIQDHLDSNSGCNFVMVKCKNEAYKNTWFYGNSEQRVVCGVEMERQYLANHKKNECEYCQSQCKYCGYVDTQDAISGSAKLKKKDSRVKGYGNHHSTCDQYPLECVNECGEKDIKRRDMKSHRDTCPREKIKCPFSQYCKKDILRKDMESHKVDCDFRPYTCGHCGQVRQFYTMSGKGKYWNATGPSHYEQCEHFPLDCVNKCGATKIKRKDMSLHCNRCPLQPLDCPLGQHSRKILRRDLEKHKREECEFRPYNCQYCNARGTYISITGNGRHQRSHYGTCQYYPLECVNQCGVTNIKRKNMSLHRDKCPLEVLDCPFEYAGCTHQVVRKDMDSHCQNNMQNHLLLVAKSHQELAKKCEEMAQRNDKLESEIQKLIQEKEAARQRSASAAVFRRDHYNRPHGDGLRELLATQGYNNDWHFRHSPQSCEDDDDW